MFRAQKTFIAKNRDSQAERLKREHAAAVSIARSKGKGHQVAQHRASVLLEERLRRGV